MTDDPAANNWCSLNWTEWQPLETDFIRVFAPLSSGVYRVRRTGEEKHLTYIGQTGRTLRRRLMELANGAHAHQCPFNDPHTAAPYHWLISHLQGAQLQFSCTPVSGDHGILRGTEDMLLWRHRVENKCSTESNYGRFYPGWLRPSNKREGRNAKPLSQGQKPPNFDVTEAALIGEGPVLAQPWWERTTLTKVQSLPNRRQSIASTIVKRLSLSHATSVKAQG